MAAVTVDNKIYWAGGIGSISSFPPTGLSNKVEIRDLITGVSSSNCVIPRIGNSAVIKGDNIVFFTGYENNDPIEGTRFEIYNTTNNTWSTGVLNQKIFDATVISVNNTIYVAGGRETVVGPQGYGGPFLKQVWKLEW
jgi:N-acetylneuraminic acid mutarotase